MSENISGTVNKAIDILEIFLQKDGDLSLTELSGLTGYDKATVYRLVSTLAKRRFLCQARKRGKYSLGLKMIDCSFAIRRNLKFIDLAYLHLGRLNAAHSTAVNLTILDADKSLMVEEVGISSKGMTASSLISKRLPLHCTACGKVLLANMPEQDRKAFYSRNPLKAYTKNTITNVIYLEKELASIRETGVAYDREDYKPGLWAIAVPVHDAAGKIIAAASVIVPPASANPDGFRYLTAVIQKCGRDLSQAISLVD